MSDPDARPVLEAALRRRTAERLADLTGDYAGMVEASRDSNADDEHDPEGATIAFERSQVGALVEDARHQLAEVEAALARLDDGDLRPLRGVRRAGRAGPVGGAPDRPNLRRGTPRVSQSRVSLRCVTRCGRAASTPSRSTLLSS